MSQTNGRGPYLRQKEPIEGNHQQNISREISKQDMWQVEAGTSLVCKARLVIELAESLNRFRDAGRGGALRRLLLAAFELAAVFSLPEEARSLFSVG